MTELNEVFEQCDEARMRRILDQWRASPEQVRGDDTAAQLARVIREIAQVRKRLDAIRAETEALAHGELFRLREQVREASAAGRDLLAKIPATWIAPQGSRRPMVALRSAPGN